MTPFLWFKDVAVAKTLVSESEYCCVWSRLSFLFGIHGIFTESLLVRGLPTLTVILLRIKPVYVIHQCYTNAFCHFSAALCLSFSRGLLSYVCSALRHKIWVSKTFTLDKACDKRSFTDLSFPQQPQLQPCPKYLNELESLPLNWLQKLYIGHFRGKGPSFSNAIRYKLTVYSTYVKHVQKYQRNLW